MFLLLCVGYYRCHCYHCQRCQCNYCHCALRSKQVHKLVLVYKNNAVINNKYQYTNLVEYVYFQGYCFYEWQNPVNLSVLVRGCWYAGQERSVGHLCLVKCHTLLFYMLKLALFIRIIRTLNLDFTHLLIQ